jgi:uncharacterized membrane protein
MNRLTTIPAWVLFACVTYLILTEALWHWVQLPGLGNIGFTLVFVVFSTVHCATSSGWRTTGLFFAMAALVSYALEEIGVRTGWIYGAYHYSDLLGPKLGHVPMLIPLAWFMMIYPAWVVARTLLRGAETRSAAGLVSQALIAAMIMTGWDTVMDPGMAAAGNWTWERGGAYFGVPLQNYFGWLLTTFLVYMGASLLWRREARTGEGSASTGRGFTALPIMVYTLYGISYTAPRRVAALQVVALFAMVMPGLLALMRIWLAKRSAGPAAEIPAS